MGVTTVYCSKTFSCVLVLNWLLMPLYRPPPPPPLFSPLSSSLLLLHTLVPISQGPGGRRRWRYAEGGCKTQDSDSGRDTQLWSVHICSKYATFSHLSYTFTHTCKLLYFPLLLPFPLLLFLPHLPNAYMLTSPLPSWWKWIAQCFVWLPTYQWKLVAQCFV